MIFYNTFICIIFLVYGYGLNKLKLGYRIDGVCCHLLSEILFFIERTFVFLILCFVTSRTCPTVFLIIIRYTLRCELSCSKIGMESISNRLTLSVIRALISLSNNRIHNTIILGTLNVSTLIGEKLT